MDLGFLFTGLVLGFSIAAPVGPIGLLCIRRTLAQGRMAGFVSGLGAATADALYGTVAGFGLTFLSGFLVGQQFWLTLVGGVVLLFIGLRTFFARPASQEAQAGGAHLLGAYGSTLALTLTNPTTIISFVAVFAALGLGSTHGDYLAAVLVVMGVFTGSALWWLILSGGVSLARHRLSPRVVLTIDRVSGGFIALFGMAALASALIPLLHNS